MVSNNKLRARNKVVSVASIRDLERDKEDEQKARRRSRSYVEHFLRNPTQSQPKDRMHSRKSTLLRALNLGVLVSGGGTNLQSIIDSCESGKIGATVRVVISDTPGAYAIERAKKHGIASQVFERKKFKSTEDFEEAIVKALKSHGVQLVCLAGFMRIIHAPLLKAFPNRIINIHPALLPSFPGLDAQGQAWEYGVKVSGCTAHFVDDKTDHGPIIAQMPVAVREDDTVESLQQRILKEEHILYPAAIGLIAEGRVEIEGRRVRIK